MRQFFYILGRFFGGCIGVVVIVGGVDAISTAQHAQGFPAAAAAILGVLIGVVGGYITVYCWGLFDV